MNHLLYHPAARVSAPRLAAWMGIDATRTLTDTPTRPEALIRYGTSKRIPLRPSRITLNTAAALSRYSNRGEQLRLLREGGVRIPHFTALGIETAPFPMGPNGVIARDYPRNGRQPTQGRGITFYPDYAVPRYGHDLVMAYIPKERQFRVHVIGGRTRVREVIPTDEGLRDQAVWNLGQGFIYNVPQTPPPTTVVPSAVAAVAALRLDFGAVDVVTTANEAWVLEVNTAPGLSDPSLEWYGTHLGRLIGLHPNNMPKWEAVEPTTTEEELA
jgi:hypothetical protein